MQVKPAKGRSATANERRTQIVAATIETIADLGYQRASFARIAERAQLSSTRLISYHFADKDELMRAVIVDVSTQLRAFISEQIQDTPDHRSKLCTYIRSRVEFTATHRGQMDALMSIFLESRGPAEQSSEDSVAERNAFSFVEGILGDGQRSGEFRSFDTFVMAATIQRAIDSLPFLLRAAPNLDMDLYANELITTFDLATRLNP